MHKLPFSVVEQVVVGAGFQVRPLLAVFSAAGAIGVLTITAGKVRLFRGTRFDPAEDEDHDLPASLEQEPGELDCENPVQASPVARPHTGSIDISNASLRRQPGRLEQVPADSLCAEDRRGSGRADGRPPTAARTGHRR